MLNYDFAFAVACSISMGDIQALQLKMPETQELDMLKDATVIDQQTFLKPKQWKLLLFVALNGFFLLLGLSVATLLTRYYYEKGGNSKWLAALVQTAAFPILLPLSHFPSFASTTTTTTTTTNSPSVAITSLVYVALGLLVAGDNMMYSYGLFYLPVSTYSIICGTELAFNTIFCFFINSQKLTALALNSVVLLTLSALLLAMHEDSSQPTEVSKVKLVVGFLCTLGASAAYAMLLCLLQLSFQKILRNDTFSVVLDMQIYTSAVASCACVVGLFASGEWRGLKAEMEGFGKGRVSYVMTLVCSAVAWQVSSVGVVGLIFTVSSFFSCVISALALPIIPIAAVIFFHDNMDGVKVVSMLMAAWGFATYLYQQYLDDSKQKSTRIDANEFSVISTSNSESE
ncbi:probable purine permease 11 [Telopea speciosissima]|uniref:probable purine permease 11 n=1 Tax=Telopea speciosissima TaxID=54955 RepID=UPI001CC7C4AD|nr:probable purine permease 11 [Telopea speciosissima]